MQFKRTGLMDNLSRVIEVAIIAVGSIPGDHPNRATLLISLVANLTRIFLGGGFINIAMLPKRITRFTFSALQTIILGPAIVINFVNFLLDLPELAAGPYREILREMKNDIEKYILSRQGQFMLLGYILLIPVAAIYRVTFVKFFVRIVCVACKRPFEIIMALYGLCQKHGLLRSTLTLSLGKIPRKLVISLFRPPFLSLRHRQSAATSEQLHDSNPFRLRADNTNQVSPLSIREWLDVCEETHGRTCAPSRSSHQRLGGLLLIDTAQARLVWARSGIRYCTLSYVWGGALVLKTAKANLSRLQQVGAFHAPDLKLPKVVEDSIAIVQAIGERYLWVDSLCIVQDDETEKQRNIMNMDAIYKMSLLTIVALAGKDANAPLPGIRPYVRSFRADGRFEAAMAVSKYETRGWTYQERLLSRRCIYFSDSQFYLQCGKCIQTETRDKVSFNRSISFSAPHDAVPNNPLNDISNAAKWLPDLYLFKKYCSLVEVYMKRELSCPEDVLRAFSGILSDFERRSQIPFVCGLPEVAFEIALLWAPIGDIKRRKSPKGEPVFPTWSWAGWIGQVKWLHVAISYKTIGQLSTRLVPLVPDGFAIGSESDRCGRTIGGGVQNLKALFPRLLVSRARAEQGQSSVVIEDPKANILSFVTAAIPAGRFSAASPDGHPSLWSRFVESRIMDPNRQQCGVLYGSGWTPTDSDEFVLLSWSPDRILDAHWAYMQLGSTISASLGFDGSAFRVGSGLFNTLLIRRKGQFSERLAVAQIHVDAFRSAGASMKLVRLI
ncbi:MAG: hypothetical protein M1813_005459 [Trichoglossum hirsutum]|nr:MAG: hypothetical protein M1813_005459 [Trichoglossum hirsutum]